MPLSERVLLSPFGLNPPNHKETSELRVDHVLEHLNVTQLQGVLLQFATVTSHAHEIFTSLHSQASQTLDRIKKVTQRVAALKKDVDDLKEQELAAKVFSKTEATEAQMEATLFIFQRSSLPKSISNVYNNASKPPNVASFDPFTDPPSRCQEKYSNPNYFMDQVNCLFAF